MRGRLKIGEHLFEALQYLEGGQILKFSQLKYQPHIFFCLWGSVFVFLYSLVEWLSGLRWYNENGKDPGSNITRCSARPWDPNSSQGFWWPSGQIKNQTQWLTLSYWAASSTVAQSWPGDSQVAIKKNKTFSTKALCNIFIFT